MKMSINMKLVILTILLVAIPAVVIGIVGYNAAETAVHNGIIDRLRDQALDWKLLVEAYDREINAQEETSMQTANDIVTAQAKITYELIQKSLDDNSNVLSEAQKEDLLNRINKHTVGKTGYVWIIDYEGFYVLSKGRQRDGENIWEAKDSDGNMVIQDLVGKGRAVSGTEIAYHDYPWLNKGEEVPRLKIAAMVHFPELEWVVGISTYYDDLVDMEYKEQTIEHVKDLMSQQTIGRSGYIWVVDSEGNYVVSKDRLRDGENINMAKDANGVLFIQEAVKKAKAAGRGTDFQTYPWLNKGEKVARLKGAGVSYYEPWDWIIGPSAYFDDFGGPGSLGTVKQTLQFVGILSVILGALIALFFANKISSPIKKMTQAGNKIADGDLSANLPDIKTGDEVEKLGVTMNMLVGAIKFLKGDANKKKKK